MAYNDFEAYEDSLLDDPQSEETTYSEPEYEDANDGDGYEQEAPEESHSDDDVLTEFLRSKGLNPDSIKIETDDGLEEHDFNSLSRDEQLSILHDLDDSSHDYGLTDDETNLINTLRRNNWSSQDYTNYISQQAVQQYNNNQEPVYNIDDYTDEELYMMDLQQKADFTEEELLEQLKSAQENPELFNKITAGLRKEYKEKEDAERQQNEQIALQQQAEQQRQFQQQVLQTIENNKTFDIGRTTVEMTDEDMNTVASFLLDSDSAGVRYIAKALNDPNALVQMAWFLTKGADAFNSIHQYYQRQLAQRNKPSSGKSVVKKNNKKIVDKKSLSIDDLWG